MPHDVLTNLRERLAEASKFQDGRVLESQKTSKETASTVLISLIVGSLFAIGGAIFGGIVLSRGIAIPLGTAALPILGRIAEGDLSKDAPAEFLASRSDEIGDYGAGKQTMIDGFEDDDSGNLRRHSGTFIFFHRTDVEFE